MTDVATAPGEVVGQRVADLRRMRQWTQQQLVDRLEELGLKMDRATLARIERGGQRAQNIGLAETLALAVALSTPPLELLTPTDLNQEMRVAPAFSVGVGAFRRWVLGERWLSYYPYLEGGGGSSFDDIPGPDEDAATRDRFAGNRDYGFFFSHGSDREAQS